MKLHRTFLALVTCLTISAPASSFERSENGPEQSFALDVGPLCVAAIISYGVEVGKKCMPDSYVENQRKLRETQKILDEFIVRDPNWDDDILASFKRRQGGVDVKKDRLCKGDAMLIGKTYVIADQNALQASVKDLITRYEKPVWGTCL